MTTRTFALRHLFAAAAVTALVAPQVAQAQARSYDLDIPAQNLDAALKTLASSTGQQVGFRGETVRGKRSVAVKGRMTIQQAFAAMLAGSGLIAKPVAGGAFVIGVEALGNGETAADGADKDIVVTGTHIRGGESASPTITIGQKQFKEEGLTDLGEVIRSVPQNFGGGQNPGVTYGAGGSVANLNSSGGSALNLRGLGADATLTLLNGHRLSYDGAYQAVDIGAIPIEAVDRLEIVPDGASAVYGSDAVGGVANVVLRRDFNGVTVGTRQGGATDGGLATHDYTITGGGTWSNGGVIATLKRSVQSPIFADQRDYTQSLYRPITLYSGSKLLSGLVSAHQSIGAAVEFSIDALRTERDATLYRAYSSYYYKIFPNTTTTLVAPSLRVKTHGGWTITASGTISEDDSLDRGNLVRNGAATLTANCYCNKMHAAELGAEGPLIRLGGQQIRFALGAGGRKSDILVRYDTGTNPDNRGSQSNWFAYGELSAPIIDANNARPGLNRLELSAAVRSEDYSRFSRVTTPKFGLIYAPSPDLSVKVSWGRSFKAPTLTQLYGNKDTYLFPASTFGCSNCAANATVLMSYGANVGLQPERARTWSATLDAHPRFLPGLDLELSYFNVLYSQRVTTPIASIARALIDPAYAQFIQYNPSAAQQQALISTYSNSFYNYSGSTYNTSNVIAIVSAQYTNVAQQRANGFDLKGRYEFALASGKMELRGNASWLGLFQRNTSTQPEFGLAGTVYYPAKFNSRGGLTWGKDGFSIAAFVNHTAGVLSKITSTPERSGSFTTFDANVSYDVKSKSPLLSGLAIGLTANNVFDRNPPLVTQPNLSFVPYDSTNYSAIGRYLAVSISKHFF